MTYNQFSIDDINELLISKKLKVLNDYKDTKTKATFQCLICGKTFENKYDNIRYWKNVGCLDCVKIYKKEKLKIKRKEFRLNKIKEKINNTLNFINFVDNDYNNVVVECLICNEIYTTSYQSLIQGCGHRKCKLIENSKKQLSTEEFILNRIKEYGYDFDVDFTDYKSSNSKLHVTCNLCGHKWDTISKYLLKGRGCPNCAIEKRKESRICSIEECMGILNELSLELISNYINSTSEIIVKCKVCGYIFNTTISYLKNFRIGCINCHKIKQTKERKHQFEIDLYNLNKNIVMVDDFISMSDEILFECKKCGYKFYKTPHNVKRYHFCPSCGKGSKMESIVQNYLSINNYNFIIHKMFDNLYGINGGHLSYDFYLPNYNLLIECQGIQHEKPIEHFGGIEQFTIQQEHDRRKRNYALDNNIELLEIWYWECDDINKNLSKYLKNKKEVV